MKVIAKNGIYTIIEPEEFENVSFGINNVEFINESTLSIDYDVFDLPKGKEADFEKFIGDFVIDTLQKAVNEQIKQNTNEGN
jgi:hypothetical protein